MRIAEYSSRVRRNTISAGRRMDMRTGINLVTALTITER